MQQFSKTAYAVLSFLPYLVRIELQDVESLAPNMRIQPSVPDRKWSCFLTKQFGQPSALNVWFHDWATRVTTSLLPPMSGADHKFNAEPSGRLLSHHR